MKFEQLLSVLQRIKELHQEQLDLFKKVHEQQMKPRMEDLISVDDLKTRYHFSDRTYYREKKEGWLKAYTFAGKDYFFIDEIIASIRNRGAEKSKGQED